MLLEAASQTVTYAEAPLFDFHERRTTPIPLGRPLRLKVVSRREHLELYLDEVLRLAFSRYRGLGGEVGLFIDRGRARFDAVRLRELAVDQPS